MEKEKKILAFEAALPAVVSARTITSSRIDTAAKEKKQIFFTANSRPNISLHRALSTKNKSIANPIHPTLNRHNQLKKRKKKRENPSATPASPVQAP